jgi:biotin carboxylase
MSRRVLLVMPTRTYRARAFLTAARRLDLEVVVASEESSTLSQLHPERELVVHLDDPEQAADEARRLHGAGAVEAVVAVDEAGVLYAARLAEALGVAGNRPAAAAATRDKSRLRELLEAAGVPQPRWQLWRGEEAPQPADFPCVVKPLNQAASRGVIRADDTEQLLAAGARIRRMLQEGCEDEPGSQAPPGLLVERFVAGPEVAAEALLRDGQLLPLTIYDKPEPLNGPFFEETIYTLPSTLSAAQAGAVWSRLGEAVDALGLTTGPIHAEFRLGERTPKLIDLASRSIGGRCSKAIHFSSGVTLEELILLNALGEPLPPTELAEGGSGVMMLPVPVSGRLLAVVGRDEALAVPGIEGLEVTIPIGGRVVGPPEGDRYLGFLFARTDGPAEAALALRQSYSKLSIEVEPDQG